jgi:hypothetical protein
MSSVVSADDGRASLYGNGPRSSGLHRVWGSSSPARYVSETGFFSGLSSQRQNRASTCLIARMNEGYRGGHEDFVHVNEQGCPQSG